MGATCISDFCEYDDENQKEKKKEYNLSIRNFTNEKQFNSSNKRNSLIITTISKTRNKNNKLQEKASTNDVLEEEDIVNYNKKEKKIIENFSLSRIDINEISNDYIEDKNWINYDISFLVDIFSYNSINEDEIIYQTELNLLNQNEFYNENIDTLTLGSKEVYCVISKFKFEIYKFNSVISSLSFAFSNDSKPSETYYKSNLNNNKIKLKINNNDSIIYSIYFYDFNLILKKYDFCPKNNIVLNGLYSIAQIEYCNKNKFKDEKKNIILSTNNPNKLYNILKLLLFLSSFCK